MSKSSVFFVLVLMVAIVLVCGNLPARADVYMKQKVHTGSFTVMGQTQPEKVEITVTWLGKTRARTDADEKTSVIYLADKGIVYQIDHQKKTYSEMPLNIKLAIDEAVADEDEEVKEFADLAKEMAEAFVAGLEVKVTETSETKKIGNWNCRKYLIETKMAFGDTSAESWATEELKMDQKLYLTMTNMMMSGSPGFSQMLEKIIKEMSRVKGVIVYQVSKTKAMGAEVASTTELLEFDEKTPPAGLYEVPAGYKAVKQRKGKK